PFPAKLVSIARAGPSGQVAPPGGRSLPKRLTYPQSASSFRADTAHEVLPADSTGPDGVDRRRGLVPNPGARKGAAPGSDIPYLALPDGAHRALPRRAADRRRERVPRRVDRGQVRRPAVPACGTSVRPAPLRGDPAHGVGAGDAQSIAGPGTRHGASLADAGCAG